MALLTISTVLDTSDKAMRLIAAASEESLRLRLVPYALLVPVNKEDTTLDRSVNTGVD